MINRLVNYIKDNNFKICYVDNSVNIVNYDKILDVNDTVITVIKENKMIFIKGSELRLTKLLDNEVLITGLISSVRIN